jgi:hypothetical protein
MKGLVLLISLLGAAAAFGQGQEREFKWDTGIWGTNRCTLHGQGIWYGNDFALRGYD